MVWWVAPLSHTHWPSVTSRYLLTFLATRCSGMIWVCGIYHIIRVFISVRIPAFARGLQEGSSRAKESEIPSLMQIEGQ